MDSMMAVLSMGTVIILGLIRGYRPRLRRIGPFEVVTLDVVLEQWVMIGQSN
jgi:hypothetical protein